MAEPASENLAMIMQVVERLATHSRPDRGRLTALPGVQASRRSFPCPRIVTDHP